MIPLQIFPIISQQPLFFLLYLTSLLHFKPEFKLQSALKTLHEK